MSAAWRALSSSRARHTAYPGRAAPGGSRRAWPAGPGQAEQAIYNGRMQEIIRQLLAELGEDPAREGLLDTPKRVEKSLRFLTSGYAADIDEVLNNALFTVEYNEMVIVKDIDFYSLCEHHLLPFFGKCHVAYIPRPRDRPEQDPAAGRGVRAAPAGPGAADHPDRRDAARPDPSAGRRRRHGGAHLCMAMRGVEKQNSVPSRARCSACSTRTRERGRNSCLELIRYRGATQMREPNSVGVGCVPEALG